MRNERKSENTQTRKNLNHKKKEDWGCKKLRKTKRIEL
jgi:hypothetical protein